jgi:hypothetical protein
MSRPMASDGGFLSPNPRRPERWLTLAGATDGRGVFQRGFRGDLQATARDCWSRETGERAGDFGLPTLTLARAVKSRQRTGRARVIWFGIHSAAKRRPLRIVDREANVHSPVAQQGRGAIPHPSITP